MAKDMSVFVNIGGREAPSLAATVRSVTGRMSALNRSLKEHAAAQKAAIGGMMDSFRGVAAFAAAGGLAFSIKKAFGAGEDFAHEVNTLRNAGRSAHEVAEGIAAANKSIKNLPTASLTGSIKLLNETTGAFGDYHHAVENLDFNSKLASVLQNTTGSEDPEHDIGSLIKALEIRGSASDPARYRREAGELQRAMTFFKGGFKADDFRTFASNAPVGIRQLSERSLTKIFPSLIQEMGGDKAGTGLTAFRTIISGRKITDKKQADAWQKLGLLNQKDVIKNKMGDVTGWKDGAIKGTRLAYQDPLAFMENVILPRLQRQGTDIADPIKLGAALNTLFKNTKANAFVTAISTVIDRSRLKKDEVLINKVLDLNKQYDNNLTFDPRVGMAALKTALENLGTSLTGQLQTPFAQGLVRLARGIQALSVALHDSPRLAYTLGGLATALTSLAALRLANLVFGIAGLGRALAYLILAAPVGAAAQLIGVARGITAISIAASAGLARRIALSAGALVMLGRVGGASAILGAVGASLGALGLSVLRFPLVALRAVGLAMWGLVANPVGIAITAIVVALTALGTWVANNWSGLKGFFLAFGESFMKGIGPGPASAINGLVDGLKGVWDWFSKILGPLDSSGVKWVEWGASAGKGAAAVVAALASLPGQIAALITDFDWGSVGSAIGSGIKNGVVGLGGAAVGGVKAGASWLKDKVFGAPKPQFGPSRLPGRYAGGPVSAGMPYIVGERGPELFVPSVSGSIKTNGFLNGMGGPTVDASAVARTRALAGETGMALHVNLDAIRKPIVDTFSIDEAAIKVASLGTALNGLGGGLGGSGGGGGMGGGGGASSGSWNGRALAVGSGSGIGHTASKSERAAFIQSYAKSIGMDPSTALRVAQSEGFNTYTGDHGRSFGDFQLFTGGGVGNRALRAGINVRDPRQWQAADKFALDVAKREGWAQWHGARRVGIGNWQGINAGNHAISRMTDPAAVARLRGGGKGGDTHNHGDRSTSYHPNIVIHGGGDPAKVKDQVESHFWDMVRQAERDQAGSLSD